MPKKHDFELDRRAHRGTADVNSWSLSANRPSSTTAREAEGTAMVAFQRRLLLLKWSWLAALLCLQWSVHVAKQEQELQDEDSVRKSLSDQEEILRKVGMSC